MDDKNFIEIPDIPERSSLKVGRIYPKKYERQFNKMWEDKVRIISIYL